MPVLGAHRFLPTAGNHATCHICMKHPDNPIHDCGRGYEPHPFSPNGHTGYCTVCGYLEANPLHLVTDRQVAAEYGRIDEVPADMMPKAYPEVSACHEYVDAGFIKLTIFKGCSAGSLQRLRNFIDGLLAQ